uniref:Uncharacterized protein n=1 Tax=Rhizophora mucronata TaxID=61149 RepID=A0A2P2N6B4_RHIMU
MLKISQIRNPINSMLLPFMLYTRL